MQPASIDLHLGPELRLYEPIADGSPIDPLVGIGEDETVSWPLNSGIGAYLLAPSQFVLGFTLEYISLPSDIGARIEGTSTLGRLGLIVHVTAGFIDPGFSGQLTLEIVNLNHKRDIRLTPGMRIAQLSFTRMSSQVDRPYGHPALRSRYQFQRGATAPRAHKE